LVHLTIPSPTLNRLHLLFFVSWAVVCRAQCPAPLGTPEATAHCVEQTLPRSGPHSGIAQIDEHKPYTLLDLIDLAEASNPRTRISWERARQQAEKYRIERTSYLPVLASQALFSESRIVSPFPKPLAPRGFALVDTPALEAQLELSYQLFDAGRGARNDAAAALRLAAAAVLQKTNQDLAFRVAQSFYRAQTAQGRLTAANEILGTAQTVLDAAEQQLKNGRATLPDVLNARAVTAQARYDLESAKGALLSAKVQLREEVGAEPSPAIELAEAPAATASITVSIEDLITKAMANRPDILARLQEVRAAQDEIGVTKAAWRPTVAFNASVGQGALWPKPDFGELGTPKETTWSAAVSVKWVLFDHARGHREAIAESRQRQSYEELRETRDLATRDVWNSYIEYQIALRRNESAAALLTAATSSYSASLEAFQYGVRNLVDVVTAQKQLAQAKLETVQARSDLLIGVVALDYTAGTLLREGAGNTTKPGEVKQQ
jgi:outer membrane protein